MKNMMKTFTHNPITLPKLKQVNLPGLRYYTKEGTDTKFASITSVISHNTKHKFIDWRKDVGEKEANRVTNRSTTRGTKMHSLIESYVGNEPLLEEVFKPEEDDKISNLLNPYDTIRAKKNSVTIDVYRESEDPLKVVISAGNIISDILSKIFNEFGEIVIDEKSTQYKKTIYIQASYYNFVNFCLELFEDSKLYKDTVETYKRLPFFLFDNLKPELNKIDNILGIEIPLHSEYFGLAGTSDCIAKYNGILSIIDYKTSEYIKKKEWIFDYFVQAVAYRYMLKELTGIEAPQLVIFMAAENGETKTFVETNFTPYARKLVEYIRNFKNAKNQEIAD